MRTAAAACALGLAACTTAHRVERAAVDYNVSFASAQDHVLLLNVARAAKKHPLLLTGVSQVSHTAKASAGLSAALPFGYGSSDAYRASPSARVWGGPTVVIGPLDTDTFMRGFLAPVSTETFGQYLESGWPAELLMKVFVREIVCPGEEPYEGRPTPDMAVYARYEAKVLEIVRGGVRAEQGRDEVGAVVVGGGEQSPSVSDLLDAAQAGLDVKEEGGRLVLLGEKEWRIEAAGKRVDLEAPGRAVGGHEHGEHADEHGAMRFVMRSPEAILYHLGQLVRAERRVGHPVVFVGEGASRKPLFSADPRRGACASCGLSVEYCGETYAVSGDPDADESMHVLSLLSQVIGLFKPALEGRGGGGGRRGGGGGGGEQGDAGGQRGGSRGSGKKSSKGGDGHGGHEHEGEKPAAPKHEEHHDGD